MTRQTSPTRVFTNDRYPAVGVTVNAIPVLYTLEVDRRYETEAIYIRVHGVGSESKPVRTWMSDLCDALEQCGDPLVAARPSYSVIITDRHGEETWATRQMNSRVQVGGRRYAFRFAYRQRDEEGVFIVDTPLPRRDPALEMEIIEAMKMVDLPVYNVLNADWYIAEFFTRDDVSWSRDIP